MSQPHRARVVVRCFRSGGSLWAQQQPPPIGIAPVAIAAGPYMFDTAEQHRIRVVVVAQGLPHPFSLAFLPNGDALVTERGGRLRLVRGATGRDSRQLEPEPIAGVPQQPAFRTGGLQEVALHPQFATNRFVYFTYNKAGEPVTGGQPGQRQSAITLARARLDGNALTGVQELFMGDWQNGASGSRLAFGPDATALHHHRRAVRRAGAGPEHRLRQGAAADRRGHGAGGQSVRRQGRHAAGDLLDGPSRSARD